MQIEVTREYSCGKLMNNGTSNDVSLQHQAVRVNGIRIHYVTEGKGLPVVLLHGWPQTWFQWRKIMPILSEHYTVVAPDLRGYGDSDKPRDGYDKRTMASDIRELMHHLGYDQYYMIGHDRGARVAHRYALDSPSNITKLAILDILPTRFMFENVSKEMATAYWHWFFNLVPELPELLVSSNIKAFLTHVYRSLSFNPAFLTDNEVEEYVRAYSLPGSLKAGFDDYRAAAREDLELDTKDAGRKLEVPLLLLWGGEGGLVRQYPVLEVWRNYAVDPVGEAIPACGHFLPEEQPGIVAQKLLAFLKKK